MGCAPSSCALRGGAPGGAAAAAAAVLPLPALPLPLLAPAANVAEGSAPAPETQRPPVAAAAVAAAFPDGDGYGGAAPALLLAADTAMRAPRVVPMLGGSDSGDALLRPLAADAASPVEGGGPSLLGAAFGVPSAASPPGLDEDVHCVLRAFVKGLLRHELPGVPREPAVALAHVRAQFGAYAARVPCCPARDAAMRLAADAERSVGFGDLLPSLRTLCAEFGVGSTVLVDEGAGRGLVAYFIARQAVRQQRGWIARLPQVTAPSITFVLRRRAGPSAHLALADERRGAELLAAQAPHEFVECSLQWLSICTLEVAMKRSGDEARRSSERLNGEVQRLRVRSLPRGAASAAGAGVAAAAAGAAAASAGAGAGVGASSGTNAGAGAGTGMGAGAGAGGHSMPDDEDERDGESGEGSRGEGSHGEDSDGEGRLGEGSDDEDSVSDDERGDGNDEGGDDFGDEAPDEDGGDDGDAETELENTAGGGLWASLSARHAMSVLRVHRPRDLARTESPMRTPVAEQVRAQLHAAGWPAVDIARVARLFEHEEDAEVTDDLLRKLEAIRKIISDAGGEAPKDFVAANGESLKVGMRVKLREVLLMNFPVDKHNLMGPGKGVKYKSRGYFAWEMLACTAFFLEAELIQMLSAGLVDTIMISDVLPRVALAAGLGAAAADAKIMGIVKKVLEVWISIGACNFTVFSAGAGDAAAIALKGLAAVNSRSIVLAITVSRNYTVPMLVISKMRGSGNAATLTAGPHPSTLRINPLAGAQSAAVFEVMHSRYGIQLSRDQIRAVASVMQHAYTGASCAESFELAKARLYPTDLRLWDERVRRGTPPENIIIELAQLHRNRFAVSSGRLFASTVTVSLREDLQESLVGRGLRRLYEIIYPVPEGAEVDASRAAAVAAAKAYTARIAALELDGALRKSIDRRLFFAVNRFGNVGYLVKPLWKEGRFGGSVLPNDVKKVVAEAYMHYNLGVQPQGLLRALGSAVALMAPYGRQQHYRAAGLDKEASEKAEAFAAWHLLVLLARMASPEARAAAWRMSGFSSTQREDAENRAAVASEGREVTRLRAELAAAEASGAGKALRVTVAALRVALDEAVAGRRAVASEGLEVARLRRELAAAEASGPPPPPSHRVAAVSRSRSRSKRLPAPLVRCLLLLLRHLHSGLALALLALRGRLLRRLRLRGLGLGLLSVLFHRLLLGLLRRRHDGGERRSATRAPPGRRATGRGAAEIGSAALCEVGKEIVDVSHSEALSRQNPRVGNPGASGSKTY